MGRWADVEGERPHLRNCLPPRLGIEGAADQRRLRSHTSKAVVTDGRGPATLPRYMPTESSMTGYTPHQAKFFAHYVTREGIGAEDGLAQSLSAARVDLNPHQVDAAMFALRSPLSKGVLLADEVGLGKTIEAALVITQRWWEGRRRLLLITPASLRKQWQQELWEKFSLPSVILDAKRVRELKKAGETRPLDRKDGIVILSYEYAARIAPELQAISWNLVVMDEAHKLRNVYRAAEDSRSAVLRRALADRQKLLLTATPLQNNLMELYGLLSIIDEHFFGSEDAFRDRVRQVGRGHAGRAGPQAGADLQAHAAAAGAAGRAHQLHQAHGRDVRLHAERAGSQALRADVGVPSAPGHAGHRQDRAPPRHPRAAEDSRLLVVRRRRHPRQDDHPLGAQAGGRGGNARRLRRGGGDGGDVARGRRGRRGRRARS